jgi:uncharacterized iron-regulated membrane protein
MISKATHFRLHKYFGLAAAAFLLVQALSGLALVYGSPLAQIVDPAGMVSGPGTKDSDPARLVAVAEARYPSFHLARLVYPSDSDATFLVHMEDGQGKLRYLSLDRHNAAILRDGSIWRFPILAALNIHDRWLIGRPGMVAVTINGLLLLGLAGTGIAFWWPKRGRFGQALRVGWRLAPRVLLRQLHRSTGVIISLVLVMIAITGLLVSIPMVRDGLPAAWTTTQPFAGRIEPALALARGKFPGASVRDVRIKGPSEIHVFFHAPERNSMAVHRVVVETDWPKILTVRNAFDDDAAWVWSLPLHSGKALGAPGRVLILLVGFGMAALAVTGPLMWLQARRARRRPRRPAAVPPGAGSSARGRT